MDRGKNVRPLALSLTVLGALIRLIPHPPNFAPVGGMSLYAGARLRGWQAFALPLLLMAVTDPLLGGYSVATPLIYLSFMINVWIGRRLQSTESPLRIGAACLACSVQFFLISNFGTWLGSYYPHTWSGLALCFTQAIPFFGRTLAGDLVYSGVLFGLHAWLSRSLHTAEQVPGGRLKRAFLSWSSGKDSAWALHVLRASDIGQDIEIAGLLTTFNGAVGRVAMHAVRRELVEAQALAARLPLRAVDLPWPCSNSQYEFLMAGACRRAVEDGIDAIVFGDLFLRDVRQYRERALQGSGLEPLFPLWEMPTRDLAREMLRSGLRARVTCVDKKVLEASFAGREFDAAFLADLPPGVDPCGENGEFHSFAYEGPMFANPIPVTPGELRDADGFVFADLLPACQKV